MGTMRDRALGIERVKRVRSRKRGISGRVRVAFEFVSGVGWWTGVRWDGDWHLAKEGLGLSVSQAPTGGPLEARGTNSDRWEHSGKCHRDKGEKRDGKCGGGRENVRKKDGRGEE